MRLITLTVKNFRRIREATLSFQPGLNVFHGPNELGKSTLVDAIRAILLTPTSASHASYWQSWSDPDVTPEVELKLETGEQRFWRAKKIFSKSGSALLDESSDGVSYENFASQRNVDGELRKLLQWGLRPPGGKSGHRGMPTSFMTAIALPGQAEATKVFEQTLEKDGDDSARNMLKQALEALSVDPILSGAIKQSQQQVDVAFTAKGRRKKTKDSPFLIASQRSAELKCELEETKKQRDNTQHLREMVTQLRAKMHDLHTERDRLEKHLRAAKEHQAARSDFDQHADRKHAFDKHQTDHARREGQLNDAEEKLEAAKQRCQEARERRRAAAAELEATKSQHSEEQQLRRKAETQSALFEARHAHERLEQQLKLAHQVQQGAVDLENAEQAVKDATARMEDCQKNFQQAEAEVTALVAQRILAEMATLQRHVDDSQAATEEREKLASEVHGIDKQLADLKDGHQEDATPSPDQWDAIQQLDRDREVAQEKLAVGLSIDIAMENPTELEFQADDRTSEGIEVNDKTSLSAQRKAVVSLPDIGSFTIRAGSPEHQKQLDDLQARWDQQVKPWLEQRQVTTVKELAAIVRTTRQTAQQIRELDQKRDAKLGLLKQSESSAGDAQQTTEQLEQCRQRWEAIPESVRSQAQQRHASQAQPLPRLDQALDVARQSASQTQVLVNERQTALQMAQQNVAAIRDSLETTKSHAVGDLDSPQAYESQMATSQHALTALQAEFDRFSGDQPPEVAEATAALTTAEGHFNEAEILQNSCTEQWSNALQEFKSSEGQLTLLRDAFSADAYKKAEKQMQHADAALAEFAGELTVQELLRRSQRVEAELSETRDELLRAENDLNSKGGQGLEEQIDALADAVRQSELKECDLQNEFEAWKLLNETLKAVEQGEASNLGNAITPALNELVSELSGGAHGGVELGGDLDLRHVRSNGQAHDLTMLSMGMQDQFATLLRVHLASQLQQFIVLDDQLVQSDPDRMAWLREFLENRSTQCQINIFTCHPEAYAFAIPCNTIDLTQAIQGFDD